MSPLYTIVDSFGPSSGDSWTSYCQWRGLPLEGFDSMDGILRPSLFHPVDEADWEHVVNEDFRLHYLTDLSYARAKLAAMGHGDLIGVRFDDHDEGCLSFLGYDLIDDHLDISLLTNWGNDNEMINRALGPRGLVRDFVTISNIRDHLLATCPTDGHVESCRIVSIYSAEITEDE